MTLSEKKCTPCQGGVPALTQELIQPLMAALDPSWEVIEGHHLERVYLFKDFVTALSFTNQIGEIAETEGHHPDIYLSWGKVRVSIYTHKIDGLTENDFILAAKCDVCYPS